MAAQLGKFTKKKNKKKKHRIVYMKWVNYMIYKIRLNKVKQQQQQESWAQYFTIHLSSGRIYETARLISRFWALSTKGGKKRGEKTGTKEKVIQSLKHILFTLQSNGKSNE